MYTIEFSPTAKKLLGKLDKKVQDRILAALERIKIRPFAYVKRLVSDKAYTLRTGDYRIIMDIEQEKLLILVIKVGHRKNVYL